MTVQQPALFVAIPHQLLSGETAVIPGVREAVQIDMVLGHIGTVRVRKEVNVHDITEANSLLHGDE